MTTSNGAAPPTAPRELELGGKPYRLDRVSARKASRALALLRALSKAVPELQRSWARFRTSYEAENFIELDRAQAMLRYPPQAAADAAGDPIREPATLPDGEPNPRAGELVMLPSPLDRMTETAWAEAGHRLRLPASPSTEELVVAILDEALEVGEDHVYRLLALFTLSNEEVARYHRDQTLDERLDERVDELLDNAMADELLELAVTAGELVESQFQAKAAKLSGRLGNMGRLFGMAPTTRPTTTAPAESPATTSTDGPSSSTPTSSTASPEPTDGTPTPSSTPVGTSPSSSSPDSSETATTPSSPSSSSDTPPAPPAAPTSDRPHLESVG